MEARRALGVRRSPSDDADGDEPSRAGQTRRQRRGRVFRIRVQPTFGEPLPWYEDDAEPNADMWATSDESRDQIVGLYRRVWAHSDATIDTLELDAIGVVPHWPPERREVTLHQILVHMIAETHRHAGHADIVRELIDDAAGLRADNDNMAPGDREWWHDYRSRLERVARDAEQASTQK